MRYNPDAPYNVLQTDRISFADMQRISRFARYWDMVGNSGRFRRAVALLTDGRFSGFSSGACIGHIGPEALQGGPISRVQDDDLIEIVIDRGDALRGSINMVGARGQPLSPDQCAELLASRPVHPTLTPHEALPDDTRLWAALQRASGGTWAGCVYDVDRIVQALEAGDQNGDPAPESTPAGATRRAETAGPGSAAGP